MNKIEKTLVDYLNLNNEKVEESLNRSHLHYQYIKVLEVCIVDETGFDIVVDIVIETYPGGKSHGWLILDDKILRKLKIEQLNENYIKI